MRDPQMRAGFSPRLCSLLAARAAGSQAKPYLRKSTLGPLLLWLTKNHGLGAAGCRPRRLSGPSRLPHGARKAKASGPSVRPCALGGQRLDRPPSDGGSENHGEAQLRPWHLPNCAIAGMPVCMRAQMRGCADDDLHKCADARACKKALGDFNEYGTLYPYEY